MSMAYIRKTYGVPARRGGQVRISGDGGSITGVITSAKGGCLMIRTTGERRSRKYHPTSGIDYVIASSGVAPC